MTVTYAHATEFRLELNRRVCEYFETTGLPRRDLPWMYVKTVVILCWFASSYWLLVFWAAAWWHGVPLCVSLGLAAAAIGFNIQHDGTHGAYSSHPFVNHCAGMTLDAIGGSSFFWKIKHNDIHHRYPNVVGVDTDLDLGWIGELPPCERLRGVYRFQYLYLWVIYAFLAFKWQLFGDFRAFFRGRIGNHEVVRPRRWNLLQFVGGKIFAISMIFVLPTTRHSWWVVLGGYGLTALVLGMTLSVVFQLAHCVEEAAFARPAKRGQRLEAEWAVWQVESTVDFARDACLLSWFLGGLNFQIEHHLFPGICHLHYRALSSIVEQVCYEYGVRYLAHRSVWSALKSHYHLLCGRATRP